MKKKTKPSLAKVGHSELSNSWLSTAEASSMHGSSWPSLVNICTELRDLVEISFWQETDSVASGPNSITK